jgi:hypothetical protein
MSDDLIKRSDVLFMIDAFERDFEQSWRVQFRANIKALPAVPTHSYAGESEASVYNRKGFPPIGLQGHAHAPVADSHPAIDPAAIREAALQARIKQLERERDTEAGWATMLREERDVAIRQRNAWQDKAEAAEAKLDKAAEALRPFADVLKGNYFHQPDTLPISMGFGHYDRRWTLKLMDFRNARTTLAEMETEPLGAEFEAVWDDNKGELYEP